MKGAFALLMCVIVLMACALKQMKDDNMRIQQRIEQKEIQLNELEQENRRLAEKERLLVEKLETNKLNLDQLNSELDQLIRENEQLVRLKNRRQKDVKDLEQAINNMQGSKDKIAELQHQDISVSVKKKKIEDLREEIRQYLKIGLKAKYRPQVKQSQ